MTVYIVGFTISIFLIYYAESKRFRGRETLVCECLSLLIPCLIAGVRAYTIGTDVRVYVQPLFETARLSSGFWDFYTTEFYQAATWSYVFVYEFEAGFDILCYICAKFFNSLPVLLFVIQALTVIPIYKGLRAFDSSQPVWLGMTVYYLMYFNNTLNMMRQWIAMAFLFYGFQFLLKKDNHRYFLVTLMAMLFHFSAIAGVAIFVIFRMTVSESLYRNKRNACIVMLLGIAALLSLDLVVVILNHLGLRYENYFSGTLSLMPRQLYYRIPIILLIMIRWKFLKNTNQLACFYGLMIGLDLLTSQLVSVFIYSGRISLYFREYYMLAYPAVCRASSSAKNRQALRWFVICYLTFYWWYIYVYGGSSATVPYVSIWG